MGTALVTIRNENKIKKISYKKYDTGNVFEIYSKGRTKVAFDYEMEDLKTYEIRVTLENGEEKTYTINYEIPRVKGNYKLVDGIYVNEPDVTMGLIKEKTRYLYLNESGYLVPGNWLTGEAPENWYNYKEQNWANVYIENNGMETYMLWIPRYVYKKDEQNQTAGNERMDVKFINTYNEYIDGQTGEKITWKELQAQGYELPEAFAWDMGEDTKCETIIPGYWISKYELSELESYVIDFNLTASEQSFNISKITTNTEKEIAKYTYALNGKIQYESQELQDYSLTNEGQEYNYINVTALDENGRIIGSMTKELKPAEVNPPDLSSFNQDTTFYVYYDENVNEHNEIPISQEPPANWYNYTYSRWANIVTRNNGMEVYMIWLPRYEYSLDQTSQRTNINFIKGTSTNTTTGYSIPDAFTWETETGKTELTGYWISKYQLSTEQTQERITAEMSSSGNKIRIKDITGTLIEEAKTNSVALKYEYYLNGELKHTGNSETENYIYENLELNKTYTVNIIAREVVSDKYVGAITNRITTKEANEPLLNSFNEEMTYYVLYDDNGNMTIGEKIKNDGSNIPENWYDYSKSKWANIVITDGTIENGQIVNANTTTYMIWLPRYEYRILTDRDNLSKDNRRTEVNFLSGTSTQTTPGYQIPEAFKWGENLEHELTGYWISKYQLSE